MKKQIQELISDYSSIINQSSFMMLKVSDVVDKAKIEAGKIALEMVVKDLQKLISNERN